MTQVSLTSVLFTFTTGTSQEIKVENMPTLDKESTSDQHVLKIEIKTEVDDSAVNPVPSTTTDSGMKLMYIKQKN
jgi:hypothetical protein